MAACAAARAGQKETIDHWSGPESKTSPSQVATETSTVPHPDGGSSEKREGTTAPNVVRAELPLKARPCSRGGVIGSVIGRPVAKAPPPGRPEIVGSIEDEPEEVKDRWIKVVSQ